MNCALSFLVVKALISFRLAYVKRFDNKPGFWGGFPRNLEGDIKARQYALAFLKPFSAPERRLTEQEKHALVVCSLAVIPPVADMEGMELEQEEPINDWSASQWATKVRDVATGMLVVPFKLQQSVSETAVNLLEKLAVAVGVPYCKHVASHKTSVWYTGLRWRQRRLQLLCHPLTEQHNISASRLNWLPRSSRLRPGMHLWRRPLQAWKIPSGALPSLKLSSLKLSRALKLR